MLCISTLLSECWYVFAVDFVNCYVVTYRSRRKPLELVRSANGMRKLRMMKLMIKLSLQKQKVNLKMTMMMMRMTQS